MDTWTLKMGNFRANRKKPQLITIPIPKGYPVVSIERDFSQSLLHLHQVNIQTAFLRASRSVTRVDFQTVQERFLIGGTDKGSDEIGYLWWVPISFTSDFTTIDHTWLSNDQQNMSITLPEDISPEQWIIANVNQTGKQSKAFYTDALPSANYRYIGFYRVNYDSRSWCLITRQLLQDYTAINVINRAQLISDALNLAKAGRLDYATALDLTHYLEKEAEFIPWDAALNNLAFLRTMLSQTPSYGLFRVSGKHCFIQ